VHLDVRFFLLFLFVHASFFSYASTVIFFVIYSEIVDLDLFHAVFFNPKTGQEFKATNLMVFQYVIGNKLFQH